MLDMNGAKIGDRQVELGQYLIFVQLVVVVINIELNAGGRVVILFCECDAEIN